MLGTTWLLLSMLLCPSASCLTFPIIRVFPTEGILTSWLNGALFVSWIVYLTVSVIELFAWFIDVDFFMFWAQSMGLYGSLNLYSIPWVFCLVHIQNYDGWTVEVDSTS